MGKNTLYKFTGLAILAIATTAQVTACAGFSNAGFNVIFSSQKNIIIWDEKAKIEHFIRDAEFTTGAP
ncbi:MAG: hypothetical protein ABL962_09025, partial [Fimbriimonadaceae bacterium]